MTDTIDALIRQAAEHMVSIRNTHKKYKKKVKKAERKIRSIIETGINISKKVDEENKESVMEHVFLSLVFFGVPRQIAHDLVQSYLK